MRSWKPKFYILYTHTWYDGMNWTGTWNHRHKCMARLPHMLQELLNVKTVGGELKLIWNETHRRIIMEKNEVTYEDIENYLKAQSCMLSFTSAGTRKRAANELTALGGEGLVFVDSYRDVILYQAYFHANKKFPTE